MATDPDLGFQTAMYTALAAAQGSVAVEVHPSHGQALPFVRIGESNLQDHEIGHEIRVDVHTFSSAEGSHEAKGIMHVTRNTLHGQAFSGGSWIFTCCREQDARLFFDAEQEEWHGIQTYRCLASLA